MARSAESLSFQVLVVLCVCYASSAASVPANKADCAAKLSLCLSMGEWKTVCGDDNRTYQSRCHMIRLKCDQVTVKRYGPCARLVRRVQFQRNGRNKKECDRVDRVLFSANLLGIFRSEYARSKGAAAQSSVNTTALDWKFSAMDTDGSGKLERTEYRQLRRLLKKVVQPRRCARSFGKICDSNADDSISRQEWETCLTAPDVAMDSRAAESDHPKRSDRRAHRNSPTYQIQKTKPALLLQGSIKVSAHIQGLDDPIDRNKDETDSNDCLTDRKTVLDEQKNGDTVLYVPECTADGRYQRNQCYNSTGYCWCVTQDSGKPIPGTSVKDQNPRCEALPAPSRPMKGCPEQMKGAFLRDLMEFLKNQMITGTNGTGIVGSADNLKWHASKEEQIATWSFVVLDKNKNKMLERKEWKAFRSLVMENPLLRRCGKKLPRYCDINHDRKISITEWLNCLEVHKGNHSPEPRSQAPAPTPGSKRKGPNPLESYLKGD